MTRRIRAARSRATAAFRTLLAAVAVLSAVSACGGHPAAPPKGVSCPDITAGSLAHGAAAGQGVCARRQWRPDPLGVGVFGPGNSPGGLGLSDRTVRQIAHVTAGGTAPRVRLSNLYGSGPLAVGHVDVAVRATGGTALRGSHHQVTFGGAPALTLAAGEEMTGDAIDMTVTADEDLLVSVYVSNSLTASTWHAGANATTWVSGPGDHAGEDGTQNYPATTTSWYLLGGISVASPTAAATLVAFGDSITDGYGSGDDANRRYPDFLARRLAGMAGGPKLSVVNAGIGGNRVLTDAGIMYGPSATHRFAHDALGQPGVKDVIVLEGVNDIRNGPPAPRELIDAYATLIGQAHAAGVRIYGGTILPFEGSFGWSPEKERVRASVNDWIRTSGAFDGIVDFDAAIRDADDPVRMNHAYDSGDHLHPSAAGYRAMADAVDLRTLAY
jgi:lysophospholipase L1-like esterase